MTARTGIEYTAPLSGFKTPKINPERLAAMDQLSPDMETGNNAKKTGNEYYSEKFSQLQGESPIRGRNPYPSWNPPDLVPVSIDYIEQIFLQLTEVFGFQYDNTKNMFDYFMKMLDSRASRIGPSRALRTIHADYIGGINGNFRKWYFASQMDIEDSVGFNNLKSNGKPRDKSVHLNTLAEAEELWVYNMNQLSANDCVIQVGLYLLIWGEANNVRFMPECLCFIFKCCSDYYYSLDNDAPISNATKSFLNHVITPIYNFYRDQSFQKQNDDHIRVDKDHHEIIGYDDMNQLFWYGKSLQRIVLDDKTKLLDLPPEKRYLSLDRIVWKKVFIKTFKEFRSWSHILTNFNRIWIIHICLFWYYTSYNAPTLYTFRYNPASDNQPTIQARLTVMSLASVIACLICIWSTVLEWYFIPRKYPGAEPITQRFYMLLLLLVTSISPSIYYLGFTPLNYTNTLGMVITTAQFIVSIISVLYLAFIPLGNLFQPIITDSRSFLPNKLFILNFHQLRGSEQATSIGIWLWVFLCKCVESYFFLTLSVKDPIRELSVLKMSRCAGDIWLSNLLCQVHPAIVLALIILTDTVLFFLDTYLWYIVCNTTFSVFRSFYIGISIWTPWRNIFSRLPKRIFAKIISNANDETVNSKFLVSQVWNSIIISMYREHLLSIEHVQKLIYKQLENPSTGEFTLKEPPFFVSQEDMTTKSNIFYNKSEAQRRITFFAQSLSTPMRDIGPTSAMPSFTVLIPHYSEKITLSLREIIREESQYSNITMLEYLKKLHPLEWSCFVKDTKLLAEEANSGSSSEADEKDDNQYYSVGFKVAAPEYVIRTRIWASLRAQTLYRTISGFMNYSRAIKLLYDVENPSSGFSSEREKLDEANLMALRKFRLVVTMQRYKCFSLEEKENTDFLLRAYPELQIAYLDQELDTETNEVIYYSALIDGTCPILENGDRLAKYRIRLSGNPILGDGKADNQNHALIFTRGEYIQLIDANQDNYLEECLKIRSLLREFEETSPPFDPYALELKTKDYANPVAIIGTREYIFSENIGILGDVAAGKEQTFGTLFARTLAHIGGKLHYGHPDFLNAIFMTTRGGVSKAQKGLHLNEDIYAGMNVLCRGGRIKHCEYMQCGKGRDLGFGSILNFTTKIGAGMGEQILSREQFYLCSKLPLDRFLSYYYAHPGFHLNNVFIILSVKLFLLVSVNIAVLVKESTICEYNKHRPITDPKQPSGCYNLIPVVHWLERSIISIFIVFSMAFLPLFVQELMERGFYKSITRLSKHFASFSPLFEVFVCKIYSDSLISDMFIGGARYIATGRGFATARVPFAILYSRFATASLYFGASSGLLIIYTSLTMWKLPLIYFWITILALIICPFFYNPNQFSFNDFFIDYRNYLKWLFFGNSRTRPNSWIGYTRLGRSRLTGIKRISRLDIESMKSFNNVTPSKFNILITQSMFELIEISCLLVAYLFANSMNDSPRSAPTSSFLRLLLVTFGPLGVNLVILLLFFIISFTLGPFCSLLCSKFPSFIAFIVHSLAMINYIIFFELLWFGQNWDLSPTILGLAVSFTIQRWILKTVTILTVSREYHHDKVNRAWWSGRWFGSGLGIHILSQPFREYICKLGELSYFVADMVIGHVILFIQFPILFIPFIDNWHMLMLFWLSPTSQLRPRLLNKKQRRKVRFIVNVYFCVFVMMMILFTSVIVGPLILTKFLNVELQDYVPSIVSSLIQPLAVNVNGKGLHKGLIKNN